MRAVPIKNNFLNKVISPTKLLFLQLVRAYFYLFNCTRKSIKMSKKKIIKLWITKYTRAPSASTEGALVQRNYSPKEIVFVSTPSIRETW